MIPESCIKKVQSQCTKLIKVWLGLTKGVTNAVIHHPNVIDIPTISEYRTKAKLTLLSSILTSKDPMITDQNYCWIKISLQVNAFHLKSTNCWTWQGALYPPSLQKPYLLTAEDSIMTVESNTGTINLEH